MHPSAESIRVRLQNELLRAIEDFRRSEADIATRPEAIRRLLQQAHNSDFVGFCHYIFEVWGWPTDGISVTAKKSRPVTGIAANDSGAMWCLGGFPPMHPSAESIRVRLQNELLRAIEDFRRSEADIATRPEAIRRLLQQAVAVSLRQVGTEGERPMRADSTSAIPLRVELSMTADMPDGQPLPPPTDCGVVWHVVRRDDSHTLWRRIFLSLPSATDLRPVPGDRSRAPSRTPTIPPNSLNNDVGSMACKAGFGDRAPNVLLGHGYRGAARAEIIDREIGGASPTLLSPLRRPSTWGRE